MSDKGFGFSFGNDDDDDGRKGEQPFGMFFNGQGGPQFMSGGLADMLNQMGQMISDMGSSMNDPEKRSSVNYSLAKRIAHQELGSEQSIKPSDQDAVGDSIRLAELWLDDATVIPVSQNTPESWTPHDWLSKTLPMWIRLVTPVAENMNEAQFNNVPDEAQEMLTPLKGMLNHLSATNIGVQLGHALAELASQALTGSDFGVPVAPESVTAILPGNMHTMAKELGVPAQDALVYLCAREAARQRLFTHVPWLVERLVASVEEYAANLYIDTSEIENAMRDIQAEAQDPQSLQEALSQLQGMDLSPTVTSHNDAAVHRLETILALVEGWVELVVTEAMGDRIPSTTALNEAWRRRRATGGSAEKAFARVVGIEFAAPKVAEAMELWRRVENAVGMERRDAVWDHPDFLPVAEDLDRPAEFIDGLLSAADTADFDPIAEITKLEEELKRTGGNEPKEELIGEGEASGGTSRDTDDAPGDDDSEADGAGNDPRDER